MIILAIVMMKSYDKDKKYFVPFRSLEPPRKEEIGTLVKIEVEKLLNEVKNVKKRDDVTKFFKALTLETDEINATHEELIRCMHAGLFHLLYSGLHKNWTGSL